MQTIKDKFKECMRHLYPNGVPNPLQHRDLVRTFTMAWMECLIASSNAQAIEELLPEYGTMTLEDWMPDKSWLWW